MVIMEKCDLKQLHLRPVRINYISPKAKTMFNGPWITHYSFDDTTQKEYEDAFKVLHGKG